jgi:hypothetical protein
MLRTTRLAALGIALSTAVVLGAGTATASAETTVSGLPDTAPIINQLYVPVSLTISCDQSDPSYPFGASASATIRQVVNGKQIAHGTGSVYGLTCNGEPHVYTVSVFPDASGPFDSASASPLFKKGAAVLSAQASSGFIFGASASAGPQPLTLTK